MEQIMETKVAKTNLKTTQKLKSIRISLENQKKAERFLALANKKKIGRAIKIDQVLGIALDLLTEEHAKKLQDQSLSNEDRKEILRQKWAEPASPCWNTSVRFRLKAAAWKARLASL